MCNLNERKLIENFDFYRNESLNLSKKLDGPSSYFHIEALKEQKTNFLSERHIEMIYATLVSWGMHRMGKTKTKMVEFSIFKNSLDSQRDALLSFKELTMNNCCMNKYANAVSGLEQIFNTLKVSKSSATLVAHSKVLAHVLPDLIPPIDRQYTVRFFEQNSEQFFNDEGKYKNVSLPKNQSH